MKSEIATDIAYVNTFAFAPFPSKNPEAVLNSIPERVRALPEMEFAYLRGDFALVKSLFQKVWEGEDEALKLSATTVAISAAIGSGNYPLTGLPLHTSRAKYFQTIGQNEAALATAQTALFFFSKKEELSLITIYLGVICAIAAGELSRAEERSAYLLDTHTIIWYLEDSPKLSQKTKQLIDNPENNIYD